MFGINALPALVSSPGPVEEGEEGPAARFSEADSCQSLPVQLKSLSSQSLPPRRKDEMSEIEVRFISLGMKQKAPLCMHMWEVIRQGNSEA